MEGVEREREGAHEPDTVNIKPSREREDRASGRREQMVGVILLCSHYFSFPDIIVWEMDITADIIAFIVNFLLYNSLGSTPTMADEMLTG